MENNGEEIKHFLNSVGAMPFHSIEQEKHLLAIIEDLNQNIDQLAVLLFGDEEGLEKHRKQLLRGLNNDLFDNLKPLHQNTLRDPEIANIEHLEEAKKRKNGFIQVIGKTTGSINLPEISQPTFAVDPNSSQKNKSKFEGIISNINQLVK